MQDNAPDTATDDRHQAVADGMEGAASTLGRAGIDLPDPTPALPAWLIDADAEESRELAALGVVADPTFAEEAERDVLVSQLLRAHHEHDTDVTRYDDAERLEHEQITRRYDRLRAPAKRQMARLASFLVHIISGVVFTGKNKSRHVGWGSYGKRKQPDKVDIINMLEVVTAVHLIDATLVKVDVATTLDLVDRVQQLASKMITAGTIDGTDATTLSDVRAALLGGASSVSKADVGKLLKATTTNGAGQQMPLHEIPGAAIVAGVDKPWFETEPPSNG